ncbi:MAG: hypothetical protein RR891_06065 [Clostridium sp.]
MEDNIKYEIKFTDEENKYTGEYGPCVFLSGKTETSNPWFAAWFEGNGFKVNKIIVEATVSEYSTKKVDELKAICSEKGIEFGSKATKDELIKLLEGAE